MRALNLTGWLRYRLIDAKALALSCDMNRRDKAWQDDSELAMVRDWFYPQHMSANPYLAHLQDMRQRAINRVNAWTFKVAELPNPVLATASLTEAMLHDEVQHREKHISDSALQSIYAMAFCRFVNSLVDRDVAKASTTALRAAVAEGTTEGSSGIHQGKGESSMFAHAAKIELPLSFVELRHRATHSEMPSLEYLSRMTKDALEWLYQKWWKVYATGDPGRALRQLELRRVEADQQHMRGLSRAPPDSTFTEDKEAS